MKNLLRIFAIGLLLLTTTISICQVKTYYIAEGSNMEIKGTSNVQDWGIYVNDITGKAEMSENSIQDLEFSILTETFKGRVAGMRSQIKKTIKQEEYPELSFVLQEVESFEGGNAVINGSLTVAGITQLIKVYGKVVKWDNGFKISGEKPMKLTDFNIEPPDAMYGSVKAADDIKIKFKILLNRGS